MARIAFCWELGANTGHVTTLLPFALAMKERSHAVHFLLRDISAAAGVAGAREVPREGAPIWSGPALVAQPRSYGEILLNFGYHDPGPVGQLITAWRERLRDSDAVIANVAPAAHLACRTLGIPSFEVSQGFHAPPATMPTPPLRDWETHSKQALIASERRALRAINIALAGFDVPFITSLGQIIEHSMLLTYPELDIYPERGPADYFGITHSAEGMLQPDWPQAAAGTPRLLAYFYNYYARLEHLLAELDRSAMPTLAYCRDLPAALKQKYGQRTLHLSDEPLAVSALLPQCSAVVCHGSHQMTAQSLLAGKPVLMLPTQLEQFIITRRVVRQGAGLGIAPEVPDYDLVGALRALTGTPTYTQQALEFKRRYAGHDRQSALTTIIARVEAKIGARAREKQ